MRRLAFQLTRDAHDAQDLEQETWLKLMARPAAGAERTRAWISTVMLNARRNLLRGEQRRRTRESAWQEERARELHPGPPDTGSEVLDSVLEAVERLRSPYRETVQQHFFEERSLKEIGEAQGIPASTVRVRLHRALHSLRADMDARHGGDRARWSSALLAWGGFEGFGRALGRRPVGAGGASTSATGVLTVVLALGALPLLLVLGRSWQREPELPGSPAVARDAASDAHSTLAGASELGRSAHAPAAAEAVAREEVVLASEEETGSSALAGPAFGIDYVSVRVLDAATDQALPDGVVVVSDSQTNWQLSVQQMSELPRFEGSPILVPVSDLVLHTKLRNSDIVDVHVGAPGYAWQKQRWRARRESEIVVRLERGAQLQLSLWAPPELREPQLGVRNEHGVDLRRSKLEPGSEPGSWSVAWEGLPAGRHWIELYGRRRVSGVLDRWEVLLEPGETQAQTFSTSIEVGELPRVELGGLLDLPEHDQNDPIVAWRPIDTERTGTPDTVRNKRSRIERLPAERDGRERWRWSTGGVAPGNYLVCVRPHGLIRHVRVPEVGGAVVDFQLAELAPMEVTVVDEETGEPVPDLGRLSWMGVLPEEELFQLEQTLGGPLPANWSVRARCFRLADEDGVYRFGAAPGRIQLFIDYVADDGSLWHGQDSYDLHETGLRCELRARRYEAVEVLVREDGRVGPFDAWKGHSMSLERVDAAQEHDPLWRLPGRSQVLLTPGTWSFSVSSLEGFAPVAPQEIVVEHGAENQVILDMVRTD